jgi:hypothetical protein
VQGEADLKTLPNVTHAYFENVQAPEKEFVLVEKSGHEPTGAMLNAILILMKDRVLRLVKR